MTLLGCFVLALLCLCYVLVLIRFRQGLQAAKALSLNDREPSFNSSENLPTLTLIVCARNEERHLPTLLAALDRQSYPVSKLEICLVDDRSTDHTGELMSQFARARAHVRLLAIRDTLPDFAPKKRAIDLAIRQSHGEIILLTDADANPGPDWAWEMARQFRPEVVMVCGYSPYFPRSTRWQKILALEYFSLAAVSAGSIGAGVPLTCTGSNFAYRRSAYFAVGGFESIAHWISGDDDLFLHKMHDHGAGKIAYAGHPGVHAPVRPPGSWREFQAQRTRYASKGRHYKLPVTLALVGAYFMNLLLVLGMLSLFVGGTKTFVFALACAVVKMLFEFFYLQRAADWFGERALLRYFPLAAVMHPFYIVYCATLGQFAAFSWRGERFEARTEKMSRPPQQ